MHVQVKCLPMSVQTALGWKLWTLAVHSNSKCFLSNVFKFARKLKHALIDFEMYLQVFLKTLTYAKSSIARIAINSCAGKV